MYCSSRAAWSRLKLCGSSLRALHLLPFFCNLEREVNSGAYTSIFCVGFFNSLIVNFSASRSRDNSSLELSCKRPRPVGSNGVSPKEPAKLIWAEKRFHKRRTSSWVASNDRLPGYVFDLRDPSARHLLISMNKLQVESLWLGMDPDVLTVTVFDLVVSDASDSEKVLHRLPVIPRRINHDGSGHMCNVGFVKALPCVKIKLDVRIHLENTEDCIGVKKGGSLKVYLKYVALFCSPEELVLPLTIDVSMMDIGDRVCLGDFNLAAILHSSNKSSSVVCEVK